MKTHQKDMYSTCSTSRSPNGTLAYIGTSISFKTGIITFANVLNKKKYDSENYFYCEKN